MNLERKERKYIFLIGIISLFLFLRLSLLFTNIDEIFAYEERTNGCITKDIVSGKVKMPLYDYQAYPHSGGTLVSGILTAPFFFLFGPSLISLKLLSLLFSLGTLILWYKFLDEYFSRSIALLFSVFFILAPPFYSKVSLIAWGNHCESNFFTIIAIILFFKIIYADKKSNPMKNSYFLLFGLLSGFSIYFSYISLITIITLFALWFIWDKGFFLKKSFFIYLAGSFAGFSPWIGYNLYQRDVNGFKLFSDEFLAKVDYKYNISYLTKKFYQIFLKDVPLSFGFGIGWDSIDIISYLYYFVFIFSFLVFLFVYLMPLNKKLRNKSHPVGNNLKPSEESLKKLLPVTYIIIFLSIFTFSGFYNPKIVELEWFDVSKYRYYAPLYPFIFLTITLGLKTIWSEFNNTVLKILSVLTFVFLIAAGLYSNLRLIRFDEIGKGFILKGYHYDELLPRYIKNRGDKFERINHLIGRMDKEYIPEYYELIGIDFGKIFRGNISEGVKAIDRAKPEYRKYLYSGIGRASVMLFKDDLSRCSEFIEKIPEPYRAFCYQGLAYEALMQFHRYSSLDNGLSSEWDISVVLALINMVDDRYKPACYFGLGRGLMAFEFYYAESRMYLSSDLVMKSGKAIKEIEDKYKGFCFQGIGIEYGRKVWGYFFVQSYFQPEQGYGLENKFYSEALENEISRIIKGEKTLNEDDKRYYYKGVKMAVEENFTDGKVVNFILNRIKERKVL